MRTGAATIPSAARWCGERRELSVTGCLVCCEAGRSRTEQDGALALAANERLRRAVYSRFIRACPPPGAITLPHARPPSSTRLAGWWLPQLQPVGRWDRSTPSPVLPPLTAEHRPPARHVRRQPEAQEAQRRIRDNRPADRDRVDDDDRRRDVRPHVAQPRPPRRAADSWSRYNSVSHHASHGPAAASSTPPPLQMVVTRAASRMRRSLVSRAAPCTCALATMMRSAGSR